MLHYLVNNLLPSMIIWYQAGGTMLDNDGIRLAAEARLQEFIDKH